MIILKKSRTSRWASYVEVFPDPSALEKGDRVARVESGYNGLTAYFHTVERTTPTQIVLEGSPTRYRRSDGTAIGDGSYGSRSLRHVGDPLVLNAQQAMIMRELAKKVATALGDCKTSEERVAATRKAALLTRQAAECIELLHRQAEENAAQYAAIEEEEMN